MLIVILDTCVLWPSTQRDFLLSLALEQIYRPVWSSAILDELEYHEAEKLCHLGVDRAEAELRARKLVAQMRAVFVDAEVTGWERLEGCVGDRHESESPGTAEIPLSRDFTGEDHYPFSHYSGTLACGGHGTQRSRSKA